MSLRLFRKRCCVSAHVRNRPLRMPALPVPATDVIKLADWLELLAVLSDDKKASLGDLERALRRGSIVEQADDQRSQEALAELCAGVSSEVRERSRAADAAYPFELDGSTLTAVGLDRVCYLFCLLLSVVVPKLPKKLQVRPRQLFEELSSAASAQYLGGPSASLRFAHPRGGEIPKPFAKAVSFLCSKLGEGEQYRNQPSLARKDDRLDIVAWKPFPDGLAGKLVLFGQCASGVDWPAKLSELQPDVFCQQWMLEVPPSRVVRAFFMPFCGSRKEWKLVARGGGVIFDRCRVAHWTHSCASLPFQKELSDWVAATIRERAELENAG